MKNTRKPQMLLIMLTALFFWGSSANAGTIEKYTFINSIDDRDHYKPLQELLDLPAYSNKALKERSLPLEDENTLVVSFDRVAIWLEPLDWQGQADWVSEIDRSDRKQREALDTLDERAQQVALFKAFSAVNQQTNSGLSQAAIEERVNSVLEDFQILLSPTDGYKELDPRKGDRSGASHCIVSSYYFRFDREHLFDVIQPSPIKPELGLPKLGTTDFVSADTYAFSYERSRPISPQVKNENRQETWQQVLDQLVQELAKSAFKEGSNKANDSLPTPLPVAEQASFTDSLNYGDYVRVAKVNLLEIERRFVSGQFEETLHLKVTFHFARDRLLNEIAPPPEATNFVGPEINPADFPTETTYVVKFEEVVFAQRATRQDTFDEAIGELSRAAFKDAVVTVNKDQRNPQSSAAIGEFIQKHLENYIRGEEQEHYQLYTQNYEIRKQEITRLGTRETLHLSVFYYFDRKALGDAMRPPLQVIPLDRNLYIDADARRVPLSSAVTLVIPFELEEVTVPQDIEDREMARRQAYTQKIETLARHALKSALSRVNADLPDSKSIQELDSLITAIGSDYRNYTLNREITHQAIKRRGSETNAEETLQLTMYFYFDRLQMKDLIQPSERAVTVELDTDDLLRMDIPASDNETYVAVFRDHEVEVPSDVQDKNAARKRAARDAVEALKLKAFNEAALDINHQLAQPMDLGEFERAVEKTAANFRHYVIDFKWIDDPQVITRGDYSTAPESLRLSLYFQVDRKALRKALVSERAITLVARYRTFVELYWNVPGKFEDFPPEMIKETTATVLENIEDFFSQKDYEIVEFENIRGELMKLLMEQEAGGISEDDLYSQDEHTRLQSNLALRSISNWSSEGVSWKAQQGSESQFEFGKRILADYADLLIGATINSIEPSSDGRQVTLRLTVNATLFERGEWVKLASVDAARSIPYEPGSVNLIIEGGKLLAEQLAAELEPRIKHKLARRKAAEEVLTGTEQVFIVVFKGASKQQFAEIKSRLADSNRWEYKSTDVRKRTARIAFEGSIDNFADRLEMFLSGAGLNVGLPEYVSSQRRIIFEVGQ